MCGTSSAVGLDDAERALWPLLRDRLRAPGQLMGLMRGVLGDDAEVAAVVTTTPTGIARPVAILVTPAIAAEITLLEPVPGRDVRHARIGEDDVEVLLDGASEDAVPIAVFVSDWIRQHLSLYARELWHRRPR